ncbi:hypothetical protein [Gordonia malaquae]|uniref:hypothetical protein n=1 Tax=Gordonia malaquae TaxID=410332 RepID=UPI0030FEFFE5
MKKSTIRRSLVAGFASLTLAAGGLMPAPAHAAEGNPDLPSYSCNPGDPIKGDSSQYWSTDCSTAAPSVIAKGVDTILGLIAPNLGIHLGDMNKAITIPLDLGGGNPMLIYPGNATISGSGFTSAIGAGGTGTAIADYVLSGAIGIGGLGGTGLAHANLGGFALAAGIGDAKANAKALPGGIALAVGLGQNASATALGGIAAASGEHDGFTGKAQTICTAVYGTAQVTDPTTGKNVSSCTSILFIFQKSQEGEGPVVYAIKNPLSLALGNPLKVLSDFSAVQEAMGIKLPIPKSVMDLLGGNIIPKFSDDLFRIVMTPEGPKFESDLFKPKADTAPAPTTAVVADKKAEPAVETPAVESPVVDVPAVETPAVEAPVVETPAVEAPVTEAPVVEAPVDAPAAEAPADVEAPAAEAPAADDAPAAAEEAPAAA